jgi:hypothetical protein
MLSDGISLSLPKAVKNQYVYKLRAYSGYFCALVLAQVIAVLLSANGTTSALTAGGNITFNVLSSQIAVYFTEAWALIISLLLTVRANKNAAFTVAGNRLSDCLSDIAFILTGCVFGGVTASLLGVALRVPIYLMHTGAVMEYGFYPALSDICVIAASTMLYMLLLSAAGYFAGVIVRLSKVFIVIIPALFIGAVYLEKNSGRSQTFFRICWSSIINEQSLGMFALRAAVIAIAAFTLGTVISNRMEVRR